MTKVAHGPCKQCGNTIMARASRQPQYCSLTCASRGTSAKKSVALKRFHRENPQSAVAAGLRISATKQARLKDDPDYRERLRLQALALPPTSQASAAKRVVTINQRYTKAEQQAWARLGGFKSEPWNKGLTKETDSRVALQAASLVGHAPYPGSGRGKGGTRPDLGFYVRSTWEADVARVLCFLGVAFEYEPRSFDLGGETYLPDFYLPELDVWVEVSGWVSPDKCRKLASMERLYPEVRILHLDRPRYTWLCEVFSPQIPMWEGRGRGTSQPIALLVEIQEAA